MFRKLFSRKKTLDDAVKLGLAEAIAAQLILQKNFAGAQVAIDDRNGHPKLRALGYVYGYIDAALRTDGHDVADTSIGVPITYHVLRRLWPDRVNDCMRALLANLRTDQQMMAAIKVGQQQCLHLRKPGASDIPMDLASFLIEVTGHKAGAEIIDEDQIPLHPSPPRNATPNECAVICKLCIYDCARAMAGRHGSGSGHGITVQRDRKVEVLPRTARMLTAVM